MVIRSSTLEMDSLTQVSAVLMKMVSVQHLMVANGLIDSGISGIYENGTILLINSGKDFCDVAYRIQNYETRIKNQKTKVSIF